MKKTRGFLNEHCGIEVSMHMNRILHEDSDIIVCHKPAGIATQTAKVGQADMVSEITNYLASKEGACGKSPHVSVVHRLDQPVEGILVFAKNKQAAADLSRQAAGKDMKKEYLALVCGKDMSRTGELTDFLLKDGKTNVSRIVPPEVKGAKQARLSYEILREYLTEVLLQDGKICGEVLMPEEETDNGGLFRTALVKICLHTGRHHQIRVQMANAGMPLLGDRKYGDEAVLVLSEKLGVRETALCAYRLSFIHPKTGKQMQFEIKPEGAAFHRVRLNENHVLSAGH